MILTAVLQRMSQLIDRIRRRDGPERRAFIEREVRMQPLTERQKKLYDYLIEYTLENGYQPSVREMIDYMGCSSPNGARTHLNAMERKGWIGGSSNRSRAIEIPELKRLLHTVISHINTLTTEDED